VLHITFVSFYKFATKVRIIIHSANFLPVLFAHIGIIAYICSVKLEIDSEK